jgi:hypothetical protein
LHFKGRMNPEKKRVQVSDNSLTCVSSSFFIKLRVGVPQFCM